MLGLLAMVPIYFVIGKFLKGGAVTYNEVEAVLICAITLVLVVVAFMAD